MHNITLLRFVFGGIFAIASLIVARSRMPEKLASMTKRHFDISLIAVYTASRLVLFIVAFFLMHAQPRSDLPGAYVPEAHWVMKGMLPYRDFESSYAPLNPYLDAIVLAIKDSALTLILFQILCDAVSVPFWIGFVRRFLPETTVRRSALLYLLQPLVIWEICLDGKNHGCISLLLAISLFTIARRETLSGISYGLSLVLVKILPSIFFPALFLGARRRGVWLLSAMALPVVVYGSFVAFGLDVTVPVRLEGSKSTPNNVPYFLAALTGRDLPAGRVSVVTLAALTGVVLYAALAQLRARVGPNRLWILSLSVLVVLFVLLTFNKKASTSYLEMCFFLICAFTAAHADARRMSICNVYAILSFVDLPISSFWYAPLKEPGPVELHKLWVAGDRNSLIMMALQALLLLAFFWLGIRMLRDLRATQETSGVRLLAEAPQSA